MTEEAGKARRLAADQPHQRVWLAMGAPNAGAPNILTLEKWNEGVSIEEILSTRENRYRLLEDRRDEGVYWLQADFVKGGFRHSYSVGGPGVSTDHDRLPLLHRRVAAAYEAAEVHRFE
ncbi:hypothetical protein [Sandarakinorhabdus rubra]|uniref:hypothetical protein n=1 Tax=Sandarakinorhabdus rubra TaxID=2672568 RepID=UPI0013D926D5|nr:hypothetical protein [Sandarakinorhabdus rubra]